MRVDGALVYMESVYGKRIWFTLLSGSPASKHKKGLEFFVCGDVHH